MKRRVRLLRATGELLVIVLGVLLALWAENWRAGQSDLRQTDQYMRLLAAEIDDVMPRLARSVRQDSVYYAVVTDLGTLLRAAPTSIVPDSVPRPAWFRYSYYRPTLPTLEAILESRDLGLIPSERVQISMRATSAQLRITEDVLERAGARIDRVNDDLYRVVEPLWRQTPHDSSDPIPTRINPLLQGTDFTLLSRSPEVAALFSAFSAALSDGNDQKRQLLQSVDDLRRAVEAELGGRN